MNLITSFGQIKLISSNITEVVINQGVEISLELVEEYDTVMKKHFNKPYAVLVNRLNNYSYAYEALLCIGSTQNLKAAAVINYGAANAQQTKDLQSVRHNDKLVIKEFSGLELGRESAINWLEAQLTKTISEPS
jgi:hypothetical protein